MTKTIEDSRSALSTAESLVNELKKKVSTQLVKPVKESMCREILIAENK